MIKQHLRIGDQHFEIRFYQRPWCKDAVGECFSEDGIIKILVDGNTSRVRNTLMHEILHAILGVTNQRHVLKLTTEQEEAFILAVTPILVAAIEDLRGMI